MRIALVYDCLFPWTVGGAERWYRNVGERLASEGHDVTYLTLRQWERDDPPQIPGVRVVAVGPRLALYTDDGRRKIAPPLVFGAGVLWHLLRHGRSYAVVHTASFPYFSLLAAGLVRPLGRFRLLVDWHEVWTADYWREYLGPAGGRVGHAVQRLCARIPQRAFCFSRLHARRLADEGLRGTPTVLEGEYAGSLEPPEPTPAEPVVVFAGRHIPEKDAPAAVAAIAEAARRLPGLRGEVYGDGPERGKVLEAVARTDGVVEASARGTPSVVADAPDNAATELVEDGVNGFVARSADPADLADAIVRVSEAGEALRASTREWFARNARRLSIDASLELVADAYGEASARR